VAFFLVSAFHEVIIGVQHINTFVDEIETIHKIVCTILDRDKNLMKKPMSKRISNCIVCVHIDWKKRKLRTIATWKKMLHLQHGGGLLVRC
jgi:hypothetical protein